MEKANEAAEKLAETPRGPCQTVVNHTVDYAVGLQKRNVRFAQGIVDDSIKELCVTGPRAAGR